MCAKSITSKVTKASNRFNLDFGPSEEAALLLANLDEYIRLLGWSRKRFYLMGAAQVIGMNQDNPQLVMQIAEYLAGVGSKMGRPASNGN